MKIIHGLSRSDLAEHAQKMVRKVQAMEERNWRSEPIPRGVPVHSAKFPIVCDECGQTYWANGPYVAHQRCPGSDVKPKVGF